MLLQVVAVANGSDRWSGCQRGGVSYGLGTTFDCFLRNLFWAGGSLCLRRVKCEVCCFMACRGVISGCWVIQVKIAHVFSLSRGGDVTRRGESSTPSPFVPEGMSHPRSLAEPRDDEGEGSGLESDRRDGLVVCGPRLARPFECLRVSGPAPGMDSRSGSGMTGVGWG